MRVVLDKRSIVSIRYVPDKGKHGQPSVWAVVKTEDGHEVWIADEVASEIWRGMP
ncbi:hypothetical protein J7M00_02470 [bacterium]|nr:hypothetical protein [bacterium]